MAVVNIPEGPVLQRGGTHVTTEETKAGVTKQLVGHSKDTNPGVCNLKSQETSRPSQLPCSKAPA